MKSYMLTGLMAGFFLSATAQIPPTRPVTAHAHPVLQEAPPESVGMSAARLQRMDAVINEYITKGRQAGVSVLVARNGRIVYHKAYGQDDITTKTPLKRDAIFRIASQTKAITSIGLMMLFEEGKFLLDDPISKYIPAFKNPKVLDKFNEKDSSYTSVPAKREITIRQLLTHTSGISYPTIGTKEAVAIYAKNRIPSGIGTPSGTLAETIPRLAALPLMHNPGDRWTYGLSTDVIGYLIEVLSGQSLDQYLRTRLLEPLGMNDTFFYLPKAKQDRLTRVYTEDSTKVVRRLPAQGGISEDYPKEAGTYFSGGAGLSGTMSDYAIFLQMMLNGGEYGGKRFLSPTTVRLITTNQIGDLNQGINKFGLGFAITSEKSAARLPASEGTFDWGGFFGTTYWVDPKEKVVALLYTQKVPNSFGDLNDKFKVLVYQAILEMNEPNGK
ncbi:serine hydrolase domain-containing protein [Spirosoma utsteinense]|uniref:CubicO group peptidase (Beta-lactamase class C family) n=1 Tax=Spirosoma utsteinense TaxID=2585773 RepID=A0ABR6W9E8_9BACT|nr:serine hydrolase [Spirosoma utsteinense]MBC3783903.1 CubicO group peptidase (beta-lactamase class C family) [Spirosoma utsteinense]MBC3792537.1 CubicO group peptidase (beta-lactamase class C family) [Spirosoma utsteinense]